MPDLEPITRDEKLWSGEDLEPKTRREMYIKHLYDETQVIPDKPITREEIFILKAGEELHDVTIEQLNVTENGTYSEAGKAYSPVIVNVPQTTLTTLDVTENGTYTAPSGTAYNEVEVDVPLPENAYLLKDIANTPASIATFTDGSPLPMPKLEIAIEPQQDLHGYDSPWVGGAGKNKFAGSYYNNYMSENNGVFTNIESDTQSVFRFIVQAFNGTDLIASSSQEVISSPGRYYVSITIPSSGTSLKIKHNGSSKDIGINCQFTATGTFTISLNVTKPNPSTVGGLEFKDVQIESGSQMTSFAPYSNICPISGWSAVDVTRCGKNLCNNSTNIEGFYDNIGSFINDNTKRSSQPIKANPLTTYSGSVFDTDTNDRVNNVVYTEWDENGDFIQQIATASITTSANTAYIRIRNYEAQASLVQSNHYAYQLEESNESTAYEPYNGQTYIIQLGDTYYGGTLDVVSGVLTVEKVSVDLSTLSWDSGSFGTSISWKTPVLANMKSYADGEMPNILCEKYKPNTINNIYQDNVGIGIRRNGSTLYVNNQDSVNSPTGQLVYELATPQSIQLTPTQVSSLMGVNNIWADCGDIIDGQYFGKEV